MVQADLGLVADAARPVARAPALGHPGDPGAPGAVHAALNALHTLHAALVAEGLRVHLLPAACADLPDDAPPPVARAWMLDHAGHASAALPRLRRWRERVPHTPLLLRCESPREVDHVLALELGADLVVPASWSAVVLAAQLRALWRRAERGQPVAGPAGPGAPVAAGLSAAVATTEPRRLQFGRLRIDRDGRSATLAGQPQRLTEGEFELLWLLAAHSGEPLSRQELLQRLHPMVGAGADAAAGWGRRIDSRVYRLRAKLGCSGPDGGIRTVRHRGYVFMPAGW